MKTVLPESVLTAIAGGLVGIPLAFLALVFGRNKDRAAAILTQQQIDAGRIETLFVQGRALDDRLTAVGDKLQEERESGLKVEARAIAAEARADSFKEKYEYSESERQRLFTLTQTLQQQLEDCRRHNQHVPQDQTG